MPDLAPDAFRRFADTAEQVAATTKRLAKAAALASFFDPLPDRELAIAVRYFAGYTFPLRDQRTTNIGTAALEDPDWCASAIATSCWPISFFMSTEPGSVRSARLSPLSSSQTTVPGGTSTKRW